MEDVYSLPDRLMRAPLCEPDPPRLEKIIAFRRSQDGGVEYLVKKRGCRYSESLWMKEEDLEAQNSAGLLDAYDRIEGKVSEPPFYNPNYDVLDSVVGMVGDRFLVLIDKLVHAKQAKIRAIEEHKSQEDVNAKVTSEIAARRELMDMCTQQLNRQMQRVAELEKRQKSSEKVDDLFAGNEEEDDDDSATVV